MATANSKVETDNATGTGKNDQKREEPFMMNGVYWEIEKESMSSPQEEDPDHAGPDVFSYAVEIANAAKLAKQKAVDADRRALYIAELARRVRDEADAMASVAEGLVKTAASVAKMALQVCGYHSYQEAFMASSASQKHFSHDEFENIIQPSQNMDNSFNDMGFPRNAWKIAPPFSDVKPSKNTKPSTSSAESYRPWISDTALSGPGQGLFSEFIQSRGQNPTERMTPPANFSTDPSFTNFGSAFTDEIPEKLTSSESSEKFHEKFPTHASPLEYKGSLASMFDSCTESLPPLWENRYYEQRKRQAHQNQPPKPTPGQPESWAEKKTMKQFQMKLRKCGVDEAGNPEMYNVCDSDDLGKASWRPGADVTESPESEAISPLGEIIVYEDSEGESDDIEVTQITSELSNQQAIRKLRTMVLSDSPGKRLSPKSKSKKRPLSPLLSEEEKEKYTALGYDDINSPSSKQIYIHEKYGHQMAPQSKHGTNCDE